VHSAGPIAHPSLDEVSRRWVEQLHVGHPKFDSAVGRLHELLQRGAARELSRRRPQLQMFDGPEFEDLVQQAADDALVKLLERLDDFRGLSRFTTWAYKFVIFEVSAKVARHAWNRQIPGCEELGYELLMDPGARSPEVCFDQRSQLQALSHAIDELTDRQREVFVAIALNDVSIDILAARFETSRNAVYKNLFDARRSLRAKMSAAGHPVGEEAPDDVAMCDRR
jgi:RNA polymerase sigma-70 factor, ECF subfamily